jgi:hypothetical protein
MLPSARYVQESLRRGRCRLSVCHIFEITHRNLKLFYVKESTLKFARLVQFLFVFIHCLSLKWSSDCTS